MKSFIRGQLIKLLPSSLLSIMLLNTAIANTGAVFVATNPASNLGKNGIVMFNRANDGTLTLNPGSPFLTKGYGSGPNPFPSDPIFSQGSIAVDKHNRFLFVVNSGSNEVSVFKIHHTGLTHLETVSSGGTFPNTLTVHGNILYVQNSGDLLNFKGFTFDKNGHLTPLPGGQCNLQPELNFFPIVNSGKPEVFGVPGQIGFTPDGKKLIIVRKEGALIANIFTGPTQGPGRIDIYPLKNGVPVDCNNPAVTIKKGTEIGDGTMPFGFGFSDQGYLLVMEILGVISPTAPGTPFNASALSSYKIESSGHLKLVTGSVPNGESAMCWIANNGKYVYVANNFGDSISKYEVNKNGALKLLNARAAIIGTVSPNPPTTFPVDMGITADKRFVYNLTTGNGLINAFEVNKKNGNLKPIGTFKIPGGEASGVAGMAIAEFNDNDDSNNGTCDRAISPK